MLVLLLCSMFATGSQVGSMIFMENNTLDGTNREGLNFTLAQEHAAQVAEGKLRNKISPLPPTPTLFLLLDIIMLQPLLMRCCCAVRMRS